MLKRLYLDNCFKHHKRTFDFSTGLTGIIGQNEAGKSLIVEMIRYALFGTKALRGKAEDYKKLHVELDFEVGGVEYRVLRKGTKCELTGGRTVSGTSPVNEAIRSIFGYGLDVFDVANACNQGNIEALSTMTPTARRAMVDKTIGLNVLDDLISHCGVEATTHRRTAEALKARLVQPVAPEKPEGYAPSSDIQIGINHFTQLVTEKNQLEGWLSRAPARPVEPEPCPITDDIEAYEAARLQFIEHQRQLERQISSIPPERMTLAEIEKYEALIDLNEREKQRDRLLAQGHLCCPSCSHQWPVAGDALKAFDDLPEVIEPTNATRGELNSYRALLGNDARRAELETQREEASLDRSADLRVYRQHRSLMASYMDAVQAFERYNVDRSAKEDRLRELADCEAKLRELQVAHYASLRYEGDVQRFDLDKAQFDKDTVEVEAASTKADEYHRARETLQALKVSVKSHLLPSLNKVSSILLAQMTGGERFKVEISDDFEITIDDQAIGTLSGSGKAVANLAIRLALGQILTNRVCSVFLADEVDAAMDEDRAAYTAQALRRLTDMVSQVVLVTHKRPETDHLFELRK